MLDRADAELTSFLKSRRGAGLAPDPKIARFIESNFRRDILVDH